MSIEKNFTLSRQAWIALAVSAAFPVTSFAEAGRVEFSIGGASAISATGAARQLNKGADINSGDTIKTTDGRVQVRFADGGYISLQPNTEFKVESYNYEGKQDGSEKGFFRLVEGGLRAITGIVGRKNHPAYRVATPVATIGIRGTEFYAEFRDNKLKTRVNGGSIYIENEYGDLILFKGQSSETNEGGKPEYSEEESGVLAKGPEGGKPGIGEQESKDYRELQTIFAVNEQYGDEGQSCAIYNTCEEQQTGQSIIAQYAAANAIGTYTGSTTSISGLNIDTTGTATGSMTANFGSYSVINDLTINLVNSSTSGPFSGTSLLTGVGSIDSDGSIHSLNLTAPSGGICDTGGCTATGAGAFTGALAESASIGYVINGVNPGYTTGPSISTTVPYTGTITY